MAQSENEASSFANIVWGIVGVVVLALLFFSGALDDIFKGVQHSSRTVIPADQFGVRCVQGLVIDDYYITNLSPHNLGPVNIRVTATGADGRVGTVQAYRGEWQPNKVIKLSASGDAAVSKVQRLDISGEVGQSHKFEFYVLPR